MSEKSTPRSRTGQAKWDDAVQYMLYLPTFRDGQSGNWDGYPQLQPGGSPFVDDGQGDLAGLFQAKGYLDYLGVGGVSTGPVNRWYGTDGPYSPTDHYTVDPRIGDETILRAITNEFPQVGINVWGDLVSGHVSDRHPLFQRALQDPDGDAGSMFHFLREGERGAYGNLVSVFSDRHPEPWRWLPEIDRYVIHRFYDDQPALNIGSPAVRDLIWSVHKHMLGPLNYQGLRWDACMYWANPAGRPGEHEPEALDLAQWLRAQTDRHFPGRILGAEAAGPRSVVAQWLTGNRAHMAWDFELPGLAFYSLVTRDPSRLRKLFFNGPQIDPDARWGCVLRQWDELQLRYQTPEVRETLFATLGENGRYRTESGLKQRLADLVPDADAHVMLLALIFFADVVPFLYAGDEVRATGDRNAHERWAARNSFAWDPSKPNAGFSSAAELFFPLSPDWRQSNPASQMGKPQSVLERVRRLIMLRNRLVALQRGRMVEVPSSDPSVLAYGRIHDGARLDAPASDVVCVFNFTPYPRNVRLDLGRWRGRRLTEYVMDPAGDSTVEGVLERELPWVGWDPYDLYLKPYGFRVISPRQVSSVLS